MEHRGAQEAARQAHIRPTGVVQVEEGPWVARTTPRASSHWVPRAADQMEEGMLVGDQGVAGRQKMTAEVRAEEAQKGEVQKEEDPRAGGQAVGDHLWKGPGAEVRPAEDQRWTCAPKWTADLGALDRPWAGQSS